MANAESSVRNRAIAESATLEARLRSQNFAAAMANKLTDRNTAITQAIQAEALKRKGQIAGMTTAFSESVRLDVEQTIAANIVTQMETLDAHATTEEQARVQAILNERIERINSYTEVEERTATQAIALAQLSDLVSDLSNEIATLRGIMGLSGMGAHG